MAVVVAWDGIGTSCWMRQGMEEEVAGVTVGTVGTVGTAGTAKKQQQQRENTRNKQLHLQS